MSDDPRAVRLFDDHHYDHPIDEETSDQSGSVGIGSADMDASSAGEPGAQGGSVGFGGADVDASSVEAYEGQVTIVGFGSDPRKPEWAGIPGLSVVAATTAA